MRYKKKKPNHKTAADVKKDHYEIHYRIDENGKRWYSWMLFNHQGGIWASDGGQFDSKAEAKRRLELFRGMAATDLVIVDKEPLSDARKKK